MDELKLNKYLEQSAVPNRHDASSFAKRIALFVGRSHRPRAKAEARHAGLHEEVVFQQQREVEEKESPFSYRDGLNL